MKRPTKNSSGSYTIKGKEYSHLFGSRKQVYSGSAYKTTGGLTKSMLLMNKWGRIVSAKKHASAKKEKRLLKNGYGTQKGKFGYVKLDNKKRRTQKKQKK